MEFTILSEDEFDSFVTTYEDSNFWQSKEMCSFKKNQGWACHYVGLKDEKLVACAALVSLPVFGKYCLFKALRGFYMDYDNLELVETFLKSLKEYLHQQHCLYFQMDPYVEYQKHDMDGKVIEGKKRDVLIMLLDRYGFKHQGFCVGSDNNFEPRWMSVLDLKNKTSEQVLKEMDAKTRQNIRNTIKTGIKVRELAESEFKILKDIVSQTGERRHFLNPDLSYYENFHHAFQEKMKVYYAYLDVEDYRNKYLTQLQEYEKELLHIEELIQEADTEKNHKKRQNCLNKMKACKKRIQEAKDLYKVNGDEVALGAAMFVFDKHEVVYLFSGSNDTYKHFKGAYAIQWKIIQEAIDQKIDRYNFYGISGEFNEDSEEYGVYLFKKGFHADVIELVGNFEYIDRPFLYSIYQFLRKIKHSIKKEKID